MAGMLATSGCAAVGPNFTTPDAGLQNRFLVSASSAVGDVSAEKWWRDLKDAKLNALVEKGLSANLDVRGAVARIKQARAGLRQTGVNAQLNGDATTSATRSGGSGVPTSTTERTALSGAYVFDLFGGVRRGQEQALAELEAAGFSAGDARLAFLSSLLGNYISARFNQTAAEITRQSIATRQKTLNLIELQLREGAASQLDLARTDADLQSAKADLPNYIASFNAAVFAIATLIDTPASAIHSDLQRGAPQPYPRTATSVGTPANLLRNVPSIRSAERTLAARVAGVGVAEAQLYPSLTLTGSISGGTTDSWSFGPELKLPILNQGLLKANRDQAIAAAKEAETSWRKSVLTAVEGVEASSSNLVQNRRRVALLRKSVAAQQKSLSLSQKVFADGGLDLLDLLETERGTLNARVSLAQSVRDAANSWVELQIATGRGWNF